MTSTTEPGCEGVGALAACLQRLATSLSAYPDLDVAVRKDGPVPCLAVRNTAVPIMSETVSASLGGADLTFTWSWGERIGDTSDPDSAALAIAYVLQSRSATARLTGKADDVSDNAAWHNVPRRPSSAGEATCRES